MAPEIYPVRSSPIQVWKSPARHTGSPPQGLQPSVSLGRGRVIPFAHTPGITHRALGPNFRFHQTTNPLGINTVDCIPVPERINFASKLPQHTLKPTASSPSLGKLENEYVIEGRDKDFPLECLHFPINPHFTERFWRLSKYFFALQDILNTFFTQDVAPPPNAFTKKTTPSISSLLPTSNKNECNSSNSQSEQDEDAPRDLHCLMSLSPDKPSHTHDFTYPVCQHQLNFALLSKL